MAEVSQKYQELPVEVSNQEESVQCHEASYQVAKDLSEESYES